MGNKRDRNLALKNTRHIRVRALKDLLGGKCFICGYDENYSALDFHHIGEKKFGINTVTAVKPMEILEIEASKCILICSNCHREIHCPLMSKDSSKALEKINKVKEAKTGIVFRVSHELRDRRRKSLVYEI